MDGSIFDNLVRPQRRRDLIDAGVTPGELRGPRWHRTSRGLYLPAHMSADGTLQRILAAEPRVPAGGAIGGWAAARTLGVAACDGLGVDGRTRLEVPVCILRSGQISSVPGIDLWCGPLPAGDLVEIEGIPITAGPRTCFDRLRRAGCLVEAVVVADQMTHAGVVTLEQMHDYVGRHPRWSGVVQARKALRLCDPMARNAWETRMRMVWMLDAGLPPPLCNPPVFDLFEGLLGHPDLFDPEAGVVFEYDGAGHRRARQHDKDNLREELFEEHGLLVARVSRSNLAQRPSLATRMQRARARGMRRVRRSDRWTLQIPPSWGAADEEQEQALMDVLDATGQGSGDR